MKIKVIIPTLNEEKTIGNVIKELKKKFPKENIIVYDGNSTDKTREIARRLDVKVMIQDSSGKGNAIKEIFKKINADIFVFIDGDDTYSANRINELIDPILKNKADMVIGSRMIKEKGSMSLIHNIGNFIITSIINKIFSSNLKDVLSGYRAFNKKIVKNINILSEGFEVETELTVKSLMNKFRIIEIPMNYKRRPKGSEAKLKTFKHGYLIIYTSFLLFRDYRPMLFFGLASAILFITSLISGSVVLLDFLTTGITKRLGTAILTALLFLFSVQIFALGLTLDSINKKIMDTTYKLFNNSK